MDEKEKEVSPSQLKQFDDLKKKHPDALLLFRTGDFYQAYKEDALKASIVLSIEVSDLIIAGLDKKVNSIQFPHYDLDTYLPKLVRAGNRVAICDQLEPMQKKKTEKETINQNIEDMPRKKKELTNEASAEQQARLQSASQGGRRQSQQAVQEEPTKTVKQTAEEKPAKTQKAETKEEKKTEVKAETKIEQKAEAKQGQSAEEKKEAKAERKPREPQMLTPDGGKVTHGHAYQSKTNPEDWYFTAKIDGKQLKPQRMDAADLAAYRNKEIGVPQLMERYYPTKLMPKVAADAYKMPTAIDCPDGKLSVDKFNVYKEKDEQRPDFGKYKFYAQIGDAKMSTVASRQDLNAYFDRVVTPTQLVEKNFGERLHLKSAYEQYHMPEGVNPQGVRVAKDRADNKWKVSVDMGERGQTSKQTISFDDGYSLFKTKTATREQIAAKYLGNEMRGMLAAPAMKQQQTASMKM